MLFMTCRSTDKNVDACLAHQELFGRFVNPRWEGPELQNWNVWVGDNGAFTGFDQDVFMKAIKGLLPYRDTCKCLTVPDVPFFWEPTLVKFKDWSPSIRRMGFPVGLAVQDGATVNNILWDEIDALFIGGSTYWKRDGAMLPQYKSPVGEIIAEAKVRNKWVHIGRSANSKKQLAYAYNIGADSVDGTNETKMPDHEFKKWIAPTMWSIHKHSIEHPDLPYGKRRNTPNRKPKKIIISPNQLSFYSIVE